MVSPTFRVRSIYDIPLIKIIVDELKYSLVQALPEQSRLFKTQEKLDPYDVEITDVMSGYGISIEGDEEYVTEITRIFQEKIPNTISLVHPVQLHAVYNGNVVHVNYEKNLSVVDIGESINAIMFNANFRKGENIVVQIKQLNIFEDQLPVCSTVIHFPGQSVILERDANFVRVSRKLSKVERDKLFTMGKKLRPRNHGLIMRTSAKETSREAIQADIDQLVHRAEELDLLISGSSYGPGILQPGQTVTHMIFVKTAKEKLTEIRNEIIPTIPYYYWFMSYSSELKLTTTFAEAISSDIDNDKLSSTLKEVILERDFAENSLMHLEEYRLNSPPQKRVLGQLSWEKENLVIKRSFRSSRGYHYGIEEKVVQGDNSVIITKENSRSIHTKVYREDKIIGELVKIVTPIELKDAGKLRYINLGLMLVKKDEEIAENDEGVITDLAEKKIITKQFKDEIYSLFLDAKRLLEEGEEKIILHSD